MESKILLKTWILAALAMVAFAANSLFCRLALRESGVDAALFTAIRIGSGAVALWAISLSQKKRLGGDWTSALAMLTYAIAFSYAYMFLSVGTGALILFGSVQATMITKGVMSGERLTPLQISGLCLGIMGLIVLFLPGLTAPPPVGALLMAVSGMAWGIYSLRGRRIADPLSATAGNFVRAMPIALGISLAFADTQHFDHTGAVYAVLSGVLASGIGYAIWYSALRNLTATSAASVQLSVPVITALGGAIALSEPITAHLAGASVAILSGIALVILAKARPRATS